MSEQNGERIIKIGRKGRRKIQLGDDGPVVLVDVIGLGNKWFSAQQTFLNDKGETDASRSHERNIAAWNFVREIFKQGAVGAGAWDDVIASSVEEISLAEALEFLKVITEEGQALRPFFEPKSAEKPSSQESTAVIYST